MKDLLIKYKVGGDPNDINEQLRNRALDTKGNKSSSNSQTNSWFGTVEKKIPKQAPKGSTVQNGTLFPSGNNSSYQTQNGQITKKPKQSGDWSGAYEKVMGQKGSPTETKNLNRGIGIAGGALGLVGAGFGAKKLYDNYTQSQQTPLDPKESYRQSQYKKYDKKSDHHLERFSQNPNNYDKREFLRYQDSTKKYEPQQNGATSMNIPQNSGTTMKPKANSNSIGGLNSSGSKLHNTINGNNQQGNSLRGALQSRGPLLGQQTSKPGQKFGHEGYQGYGPENRPNIQMGSNVQGSGMGMNRGGQQQGGMNPEMQRVMQLQQNLIKAGFPIQADGMWGPQTEKAYFAWKRNNSGNLDNAESQGGVYRDRASDGMADAERQGGVFQQQQQQQPQIQVQESTTPLDYNEVEQSMPMVPQGQGNQSSMESEGDKWNRLAGTQNQAPQRKKFLGGLFGR